MHGRARARVTVTGMKRLSSLMRERYPEPKLNVDALEDPSFSDACRLVVFPHFRDHTIWLCLYPIRAAKTLLDR
jgi:hypothetical protein